MSGADQPAEGVAQLWSRPQHAVAYQEARAVLNSQQKRKTSLEDKALRTTRLTAVVVGALITAVEAFGFEIAGVAGFLGIGLLVVAFATSLAAYSVEGPTLGPNTAELRHLVRTKNEDWEQNFLVLMSNWMEENTRRIDRSSLLLLVSDIVLVGGVVVTLYAVLI